jgi:putative ABC transport system permease protein
MIVFTKVFSESIAQAMGQLAGNKLRSFLSLLGITIGIFCIIGVQAAVDSLEENIMDDIKKLGSDVVYVTKFSWMENPHEDFLKIMRRPNPSYADYKMVNKKVQSAHITNFDVDLGRKTAKYLSNSVENVQCNGTTYEFAEMYDLQFENGRYFSSSEYHYGAPKVIMGHNVATELFGTIEPIGKTIKLMGRKLQVIGVIEKSGESLIGFGNFDDMLILPFELARKMAKLDSEDNPYGNASLAVKAVQGVSNDELKDDLTGVLRAHRKLKPKEEDNFGLNEISIMEDAFQEVFKVLNILGLIIGGFAILVGVFSVANIMFVSVKERTNIIGIKKALGAKRYVILTEFLIEAIILCLLGGVIGLVAVYGLTFLINTLDIGFTIKLSMSNILSGLIWSTCIGIIAGLIPATQASGMDPVEAMRAK